MTNDPSRCSDCEQGHSTPAVDRRRFLKTAGIAAVAASGAGSLWPAWATAKEETPAKPAPDTLVKKLYDSLNETQRKDVAYDWDFKDNRGLLRTHVSNNWHINGKVINTDYFTKDQKDIIRAIYEGIYNPEWVSKIDAQLKDDAGGYGNDQNIAIFGKPGEGKFEFVMTGRHLTTRCDGNTAEHVAFGGPLFYGHAASGFNEKPDHPNNVFWPQALEANKVFAMLDGTQRKKALVARAPQESAVDFKGEKGPFPGLAVSEMSADQKEQVQKVLAKLLEPYRETDKQEALECLKKQGGLDKCALAFYQGGDLGDDGVWDNWRLEGPSFVWYFRGAPHVHVWVNVADDASVATNAKG